MNFNLIHWLFDDPYTAGTNAGLSGPETFHYLYPWLIFCSVGVLIAFYYSVEGRKRFVKNKPIIKYMLDRYLGWLTVICLVGYPMIFARDTWHHTSLPGVSGAICGWLPCSPGQLPGLCTWCASIQRSVQITGPIRIASSIFPRVASAKRPLPARSCTLDMVAVLSPG